jgi:phage regulator Rha-like protein
MAIQIVTHGDSLVVDSRLIAEELGIEHASLIKTIKKHIERLGRKKPVRFEIDVVKRPQGGTYEVSYCYLNEYQATLLMTFSRNTEQVLNCKEKLVDGFEKAKKIIKEVIPQQSDRIRELELENENLRLKSHYMDRRDAIRQIHGVEMLALLDGRPDAVVPVREVIRESVICKDGRNVSFVGKSLADLGRELGIKTGKEFEQWLERSGRGDLISQGMRAVSAPYIAEEDIQEVKRLWLCQSTRARQLLLGES